MSINRACGFLGHSKQAYFKAFKNKKAKDEKTANAEEFILKHVKTIRKDMPKIGGLKLFYLISPLLKGAALKVGRDRFIDILGRHNLLVIRKKRRYTTTDSSHWRNQFGNLVEGVVPSRPEQVWVGDITYIETEEEGAVYGHFITDAYSKKIMGFEVSVDMEARSTIKALKMALKNRQYQEQLTHHSDRGSQYCSAIYTKLLKKNKIMISMTQDGSPYDNAVAERINGILKDEFLLGGLLKNIGHAKELTAKAVGVYNGMRPHWSNHLLTPEQMHQQDKIEIKTWRAKKED